MTEQKRRSMKNLLIKKGFQGRILMLVILGGFVCSSLNGVLYYTYVTESYDFIFQYYDAPQVFMEETYKDLMNFGLLLLLISFLITAVIALYALIMTHRAAGACYRLELIIQEIKSGNIDARVHLRKKDEFQELAEAFNEMMDALK